MGQDSNIQWTTHTFNGVRGCVHKSAGCLFCYAELLAKRNPATLGVWGAAGAGGTRVVASESMWANPPKWDRAVKATGERHRVFAYSLADVFETWDGPMLGSAGRQLYVADAEPRRYVPMPAAGADGLLPEERANLEAGVYRPLTMDDIRVRLFNLIYATRTLDWMLLTKRAENLYAMWTQTEWPKRLPNAWIGVSVEDRKSGVPRIEMLRRTPAAIRFLSCEPLLEDLGELDLREIHLVIVGGESGSKARPFDLAWARSIRDQCKAQGVAFFMKQMGAHPYDSSGADGFPGAHQVWGIEDAKSPAAVAALAITLELMTVDLKDSHGGDWDEWPADLRVRQMPPLTLEEAR